MTNQGSKVAQPPHVEICDKQRLIDVDPSGGQQGVHNQKAPQDSELYQNIVSKYFSRSFKDTFGSQGSALLAEGVLGAPSGG